jgi:hypothetical protein
MSKKKETDREILIKNISKKAFELGFKSEMPTANILVYKLPLGFNTELWLDLSIDNPDISLWNGNIIEIRKIESPEDLEMLFNAICPEKYRLPFE